MLSGTIAAYVTLQDDQTDSSDIPTKLANGIGSDYRLLDIVKELGPALTSENAKTRCRGIQLLSDVVQHLDPKTTDRQSTMTLTSFFGSKLSEQGALVACVRALTALSSFSKFGVGEGVDVANAIFEHVELLKQPQATRYYVYKLFDQLMTNNRRSLQRLGPTFIKKYCDLVEGEKDPRNLMISFNIVRVILLEFDVTESVEGLFDITFCYFPITFTPPPDDPYGISSDDLIQSLRSCLSASGAFGPLALPLFMDKLQAASEKAKRQTLQALIECFPVYGPASVGEWADRFSEALWIEVFHATDESMMELALQAYGSLFKTLYPDASSVKITSDDMEVDATEPTDAKGVAEKVTKNCLSELEEPEKSNAKPAVRILSTMVSTSTRVARHVLSQSLDKLVTMLKDQDLVPLRASIFESITDLLRPLTTRAVEAPILQTIVPHKDDLLSTFASGSRTSSSSTVAIDGLVILSKVPGLLDADDAAYAVSAINDVMSSQESSDESYDAALDALVEMAPSYPRVLEESTLPALFSKIPSEAPAIQSSEDSEYRMSLEALSAICLPADLFEIFVLRLTARLEAVCNQDIEANPRNSLFAHHLLSAVYATMANKVDAGHIDVPKYIDRFVPRLLGMFIVPTLGRQATSPRQVALDTRLLIDAGKIVTLVNQTLPVERQSQFSSALTRAFHHGDLSQLLPAPVKTEAVFEPLSDTSSSEQRDLVILFSAAVISMRPDTAVADQEVADFLTTFLDRVRSAQNDAQLEAMARLVGTTVNKRAQGMNSFLSEAVPTFWASNVRSSDKDIKSRQASLKLSAWIVKGLVLRSDQKGYQLLDDLLDLFNDPSLAIAESAARSLRTIADDSDRVLAKEHFAVIRLLYKQRFFSHLLPKIVEAYKGATSDSQKNTYLIALSSVLQYMPKQLSLTELPKLLPLLITSLELQDASLRANVLGSLRILVQEAPSSVESSISSIALKAMSAYSEPSSSPALRIAAIEFLGALPDQIPYSTLHPQKVRILKELGKALDDPRKDVRKAAVACRSKWFMYKG